MLLVVFSAGVLSQTLEKDCKKILLNPEKYPFSWISECSKDDIEDGYRQLSPVTSRAARGECPDFDPKACSEPLNCMLGYLRDERGCEICECNTNGAGELFEEDIVVVNRLDEFIKNNYDDPTRVETDGQRGAAKSIQLWTNVKVGKNYIVPYVISNGIGAAGKAAISAAAKDFERYTCLRLQRRNSGHRENYINFYRGGGCSSPVGRVQQRQDVSLASGCWQKGTVIHEVLHSLGFWHEQSRPDRDRHVRINLGNIPAGVRYNFNKFSYSQIDSLGSPYDLGSVMHYNGYAFSQNGRPTIVDLSGRAVQTQRNGFSKQDLFQLNKMYGCETGGTGGGGGTCQDKDGNCPGWARETSKNYCKTNQYVIDNCCKSCKGTTPTTARPTTRRTTTRPPTSCSGDRNSSCRYWASIGECTKNPAYMKPNCCRSCSTGTTGNNCSDSDRNCARWAPAGYCSSNYYVRVNCRRSCRFC